MIGMIRQLQQSGFKRIAHRVILLVLVCIAPLSGSSQTPKFSVLAFYSTTVEKDHVLFAQQAIQFFSQNAKLRGYDFTATTNWDELNTARLKQVKVVLWLDDFPHSTDQRAAFENYMRNGGGWLGFHIAAYNDEGTQWPWFVQFLGGGVFYGNNWPPLPALLDVDRTPSPVTRRLPAQFTSPANEWYIWQPSPRLNKDVKVLVTLDKTNFPLGLKDTIKGGDVPVIWSNTKFKMIYMNMGHGEKIFTDTRQNQLFENAILWLGTGH